MYAEPKYPVDVSYLVSDLKYSTEHGIKICEVQHGSLSAVDGDLFIAGGDGNISPQIADFFALLPLKKWAAGLLYPPLKRSLAATGWQIVTSWQALLKDPTFLEHASSSPVDPFYVSSYAGIVYADFEIVRNIDYYRTRYPGILFMNAATFPYWRDKYKMNALFDRNDELKQYKAEWRLYPKNYDQFLSERIQKELPAQMYVIKPRSEVLAVGVIVVARENLDDVLRAILEPSANLGKHPDKKYAYWMKNTDDSFIIEKYYESDYISFTPPVIKTTSCPTAFQYDATMRLAFILQCDGGTITYHNLGGFWKLPCKALGQDGTLNEERISYCKPPFYAAVEPELLNEVAVQMEKAMTLLYRVMLNEYSR
jgi:hypothetical protein